MSEYFSIFYYKVEYICICACAFEDEWEVVKMDEYVFKLNILRWISDAEELNANKINVILFNYL